MSDLPEITINQSLKSFLHTNVVTADNLVIAARNAVLQKVGMAGIVKTGFTTASYDCKAKDCRLIRMSVDVDVNPTLHPVLDEPDLPSRTVTFFYNIEKDSVEAITYGSLYITNEFPVWEAMPIGIEKALSIALDNFGPGINYRNRYLLTLDLTRADWTADLYYTDPFNQMAAPDAWMSIDYNDGSVTKYIAEF